MGHWSSFRRRRKLQRRDLRRMRRRAPIPALKDRVCGAQCSIKANSSRTLRPYVDCRLYRERHQVESFFNELKRPRRIGLRCDKTLPDFMGFLHLACALIWLRGMQTGPCGQQFHRQPQLFKCGMCRSRWTMAAIYVLRGQRGVQSDSVSYQAPDSRR